MQNNNPLVSVPVITYNSSKYVLETLESIKAQTYQNIELIVSDDCSTDNTVEICRKWIEENKERFIRTEIITSEINTGVSANGNRGRNACRGEWIKGIAGDDLLMPNCIQEYIDYVNKNRDQYFVFAKIEPFGSTSEMHTIYETSVFDSSFFDLKNEEQLERLIFTGNCIPASTCFYNRNKAIENEIINDERIPLLEDWPKWIKVLERGLKLGFINKKLIKYRIHEKSLSTSKIRSIDAIRSNQLFIHYYLYPKWRERNLEEAINRITNLYVDNYQKYIDIRKKYDKVLSSKTYRLGHFIMKPFMKLKNIIHKAWLKQS